MSEFVHLHVHTAYSLLDGAIRLDPLLERVQEYGMEAVAQTDHGAMFGAVEFYQKAKSAGVKPIIGCEFYMCLKSRHDKTPQDKEMRHLVLLAENYDGWQSLCALASKAQLEGFYYKPRIDRELLEEHHKGLICLSACLQGEVAKHLRNGDEKAAEESALWFKNLFGPDRYYLEIQNNGVADQEPVNQALIELGKKLDIPLVATNDCHYLDAGDSEAHDVLLCVQTGKTIHDKNRMRFGTDQLYLKPPQEMIDYFRHVPEAISNTKKIADMCNVELNLKEHYLPQFPVGEGETTGSVLDKMAREGLKERLAAIYEKGLEIDEKVYWERLDYELGVILEMDFPGYFLIVSDFIQYAKDTGIPVGPGRGSAAGSLVAYSLRITDIDPIEHGLIFERFLNSARKSMPDIDVDFCIIGREEVFNYVERKYGESDFVSQIITFGRMKARAVIRDVGRALGVPLADVDRVAKLVPEGPKVTLAKALKAEPALMEETKKNPEIKKLLTVAKKLEGLPRHASIHAAGVVIGDIPLQQRLPLYRGKNGEVVTQFEMSYVEKIGLVKFDFLGLRNLTVIADALKHIESQGKTAPDMVNLDLTDQPTYELLQRGDTTGVFQLESSGMKNLLVRMKPENFNDVIALVALYRPGPLESGMVDQYVQGKHGEIVVEYLLPELEPILKDTYGVIVYQEQVMQIAAELANYSMSEADDLRKAMGKKIAEIMAKQKDRFLSGAAENQLDPKKAETLFDLMEKFGGYGFNKSHSAAYALIAYQTAYLKTHFPVEFMAALLTSEKNSTDGVVKFMAECASQGIEVTPPDVNVGNKEFSVANGKIVFGLVAVKNVGEGAIEAILESREQDGPFSSIFDFCRRVDLRRVNKRVLEALIKCGAFDSTGFRRSQMMAVLEQSLEYGQRMQREQADPQMGLFDAAPVELDSPEPELPDMEEWDDDTRLSFEKEALGLYVSGHPLDQHRAVLEKFSSHDTLTLQEAPDGILARVGGMVRAIKKITTKRGEPMAFVTLEDFHGTVEMVVFPPMFREAGHLLQSDAPMVVQAMVQKEEEGVKLLGDAERGCKVVDIGDAEAEWTANIHINFNMAGGKKETLEELHNILKKHPGVCTGFLHMQYPKRAEAVIELPDDLRVKPGRELEKQVTDLLGFSTYSTRCEPVKAPPPPKNQYRGKRA